MFKTAFLSVILWLLLSVKDVWVLQCFNCSNISDPSVCKTTIMCNSDEACYQDSVTSGQTVTINLGCIHIAQCGVTTKGPGTLIGRDITKRQNNECHECCSTDRCNELLCARRNRPSITQAPCEDTSVNCHKYGADICTSAVYSTWAEYHCARFCKFCNTSKDDPPSAVSSTAPYRRAKN
ncbi:uncharacterized protein LOC123532082 isoform X2 [Mercenaria mercenaria]|uniref:uncharacterized protein LOC123532082 isoform X2 n=1 Tax=Mercenaria mercenaria TaxID=6596 RepID=UPI00234E3C4D|nr:uncharacterized protein LOC123532082 isoform X2 [Mercenaria mercenaria]